MQVASGQQTADVKLAHISSLGPLVTRVPETRSLGATEALSFFKFHCSWKGTVNSSIIGQTIVAAIRVPMG